MIPRNLLSLAMGALGQAHAVTWEHCTGRTTNAAGYMVPSYAAPAPITGNVQPIPKAAYEANGLDATREYVMFRTPAGVVGVGRDESGDRITYDGKTYLCESLADWVSQNGWAAIVAVRIPA